MSLKTNHLHKKALCGVCGDELALYELTPAEALRPQLAERIDRDHPGWREAGRICRKDLAEARRGYVQDLLVRERGELTELDHSVVESLSRHEMVAADIESEFHERRAFGDRLADQVAGFGGSWTFICTFLAVLAVWMAINALPMLLARPFDPYPFILLNLLLSCVAAFQAPIIMMSQRRQEAKDRLRSENDYRVNLKAELEIRQLHEKLDHLLIRQWERLTEIQQIQLELMEGLDRGRRG